jgi:hypothetical protein
VAGHGWCLLSVVDDAREQAQDGHAAWSESFSEMFAQVAGVFGNARVRGHGRWYLLGLLSHQERKNSWWPAELAGDVSPDGIQRLLNFSPWDEDAARDALARYVAARMGDPPPCWRWTRRGSSGDLIPVYSHSRRPGHTPRQRS